MTLTVSVSQFRQHIASYLAKAEAGNLVIVKDEKKGQQIAQLSGKKKFDPEAFSKALKNASGILTAEYHPEWKTKQQVMKWIKRERLSSDRIF